MMIRPTQIAALALAALAFSARADDPPADADPAAAKALFEKAKAHFHAREDAEFVAAIAKAIEADPKNSEAYAFRAAYLESQGEFGKAIADHTKLIELHPNSVGLVQKRAVARFFDAQIAASVEDFDKVVEMEPKGMPYNWQRGIALYYAGRYDDARKQFEEHQTVNPHDVENAAWHFLSTARAADAEVAKKSLIDITGDERVPMAEVQEMFGGTKAPEEVVKRAMAAESEAELRNQLCYAHLYIGLYFEATGDAENAKVHIKKAATEFKMDHYMGRVAQVHLKVLEGKAK